MAAKQNPEVIVRKFADQMQAAFGPDLESLLLVGSAARGDFLSGQSDVNTLVILSEAGMEQLEKAHPVMQSWRRSSLALPHFMTLESLQSSVDSYPLELLDFRSFHRAITGSNPLVDLKIPREPLRLQVEREARGKQLLLRQTWAAHATKDHELSQVMRLALKSFTAIFQGLLELKNLPLPASRPELFDQAAKIAGCSAQPFQQIHEMRLGRKPVQPQELFRSLLHEAGQIVSWVDNYSVSDK
jgi:hypothetical protein